MKWHRLPVQVCVTAGAYQHSCLNQPVYKRAPDCTYGAYLLYQRIIHFTKVSGQQLLAGVE
jgi:hypothetical protein